MNQNKKQYKGNYHIGQKVQSTAWREIGGLPILTILGFEPQEWMGEKMWMVTVTDGIHTSDVWEDTIISVCRTRN